MILIIPDISPLATINSIKRLVETSIRTFNPFKQDRIEKISIIEVSYHETKTISFHVLICMSTPAAGRRVMKKLNNRFFIDSFITVKEYVNRSWHNDPRKTSKIVDTEHRIGDRRMHRTTVDICDNFACTKQCHLKK